MVELKSCPCGGNANDFYESDNYRIAVQCFTCGLRLPFSETLEEAIADWNDHPMHQCKKCDEKDSEIKSLWDRVRCADEQIAHLRGVILEDISCHNCKHRDTDCFDSRGECTEFHERWEKG